MLQFLPAVSHVLHLSRKHARSKIVLTGGIAISTTFGIISTVYGSTLLQHIATLTGVGTNFIWIWQEVSDEE